MTTPSPTSALDALLAFPPAVEGVTKISFPDQWQQGRGAFGGLVTAALVRALETVGEGRPLRSLTSEICGPVQPGESALEIDVLRTGNAVTTAAVRLVQNGEVQAHGVGVLGKERMRDRDQVVLAKPTFGTWKDVEVLPIEPPLGPVFAQHFEFRVTGPLPFSGETEPRVEGWVRPKNPGKTRDAAYLAACIDSYWPSLYTLETMPRPMATIAFTFQPFVHFEGLDPEAPLFFRSRAQAVDAGYFVEFRELWGEDGRLLALNQQTMVIIK